MSRSNHDRRTALGILCALFLGLGAGAAGCSSGSARSEYYAARAIVRPSEPGDGSVISIGPASGDSVWTASLTLVPIESSGDLAAAR